MPPRTTPLDPRREIAAYLLLAYGLALAVALALPHARINLLLSVAIPTVVVALLTVVTTPRGSRAALWRGLGLGRVGLRSWPAAVLLPVALCGAAYAVAVLAGVGRLAPAPGAVDPADVAVSLVLGSLVVMGEEIGWRGYLLPRLQTVTGPRRGAVLTGALHGGIHLPLILLATTYDTDGPRWSAAVGAVLTITGAGVVYAWLRGRSGSLWPVALAHGTANTVFDVAAVAVVPTGAGGLALVAGETGVATWLVCGLAAAVLLSRSPVWDRPAARPSPAPAAAAGSDRAPAGV